MTVESPRHLSARSLLLAAVAALGAIVAAVLIGPAGLDPGRVLLELVDRLPLVEVESGLSTREAAIVWELRVPRAVLGALVGATLAMAGAAYQGVFRNPLADPYLLGVAAGAGLGATLAIVTVGSGSFLVPVAAFAGALAAVAATYALGAAGGGRRTGAALILAGVAVAAFLTAVQTFVQQRNADTIREVYAWILGRLGTTGWGDVALVTPYAIVSIVVILLHRRLLDVLAVGEDEARTLGVRPERVRAGSRFLVELPF
jgi:iron complex transport system permease protein